jgi:hypothetical protein
MRPCAGSLLCEEIVKSTGWAAVREEDSPTGWWVSPYYFGIDQGPVGLMIENYRNGLIWDIMRRCPYVRAGFTGGWL